MAEIRHVTPRVLPNDNSIVLLDGGVGAEVFARLEEEDRRSLWSSGAFYGNGKLILKQIHSDYFNAGSQIATANTYVTVKTRMENKYGRRNSIMESAAELCTMAVGIAKEARDMHGSGLLAGSLGPLFNSYRPDQDHSIPFDEQVEMYRNYMKNLKAAEILLFETISSVYHFKVVFEAVKQEQPSQAVWISVTVDDNDGTRLRSGENVEDIFPYVDQAYVEAILVNCSKPEVIGDSLHVLEKFGIPFGAYGNNITNLDAFIRTKDYQYAEASDDMGIVKYSEFVMDWIKMGAKIVGGCCEIGPRYIEKMAESIRKEGYALADFPVNEMTNGMNDSN